MNSNRSRNLVVPALIVACLLSFAAFSYSGEAPPDDWKAPARAARKENPVPASADSIAAGKGVYLANCLACHGGTGKGDGPAAAACNPRPKDLSDPKIASQTDGELFWKITEGKKPMPTYEKLLTETQRWQAIDYLRTLAPKPAK